MSYDQWKTNEPRDWYSGDEQAETPEDRLDRIGQGLQKASSVADKALGGPASGKTGPGLIPSTRQLDSLWKQANGTTKRIGRSTEIGKLAGSVYGYLWWSWSLRRYRATWWQLMVCRVRRKQGRPPAALNSAANSRFP